MYKKLSDQLSFFYEKSKNTRYVGVKSLQSNVWLAFESTLVYYRKC